MNKTLIILKREYLLRVKKKSFIVMTILGPILMAALMIVPIFISQMSDKKAVIAVVDETTLFTERLKSTDNIKFIPLEMDIQVAKDNFDKNRYDAILYIPMSAINTPSTMRLLSDKYPSITVKLYIESQLKQELESMKLSASGIDKEVLKSIETRVNLTTIKITEGGKEETSYPEVATALGIFAGILIYMFIFMFGAQVMRGVIEEKTSRIIEVIVSSVKPFQLMMGKIVGVALVGLTQFLLWIVLTFTLVGIFRAAFPEKFSIKEQAKIYTADNKMLNPDELSKIADIKNTSAPSDTKNDVLNAIASIDFGVMIASFIFYFLAGYLLYAALFAAIGSAVDNEADTQQFMMPVTIPLIFAIVMAQFVMNNPNGPVAFWLSIIPFTSPVIMMIRIPFGVPYFDLILSIVLLIAGFIFTTWFAAKIYRTGILMYGKKVNYRELAKWLFYKS
ncbi:MAG: ABC-2 family transporter protein [Bacteroidetes bacterium ADurb.Bin408]|nr:MAG: ABC-2 family transporter protein [Bacteroidetes bacterium ADurb.Bin408]